MKKIQMTLKKLQLNRVEALDSYVNLRMVLPTILMAYTGRLHPKGVPAFYGTIS